MPQEKPQPEAFSLYASVTQTTCNLFTRFEKLEPNSFPIKEMKITLTAGFEPISSIGKFTSCFCFSI